MSLIKATNLSHSFDCPLYRDISLECRSGESIAILGVSGSGKSTILNNLSTLLKPDSGVIDLLSFRDIYSLSNETFLKMRRFDIGIVFQSHYLFRGFNGIENIKIASILSGVSIDVELLATLGILDVLHQQIGELSGGQQQRLSIARVLSKKPKLIFADEPTGNLDKQTAIVVAKALLDFVVSNGAGMVLATHDEEIASMCTLVYRLEDKRLIQI